MKVTPLELEGLTLIEADVRRDTRGFFTELFHGPRFAEHGLPTRFVQVNRSRSSPRVLRGLHFQADPWQGKLVTVIRGRIFDVAVDLRLDSPTFGRYEPVDLGEDDGRSLWIPAGFGHGFCVLGDDPADVLYTLDAPYKPAGEGGVHWADPEVAIDWPLADPVVSARDAELPSLAAFRASRTRGRP